MIQALIPWQFFSGQAPLGRTGPCPGARSSSWNLGPEFIVDSYDRYDGYDMLCLLLLWLWHYYDYDDVVIIFYSNCYQLSVVSLLALLSSLASHIIHSIIVLVPIIHTGGHYRPCSINWDGWLMILRFAKLEPTQKM